MGGTNNIEDLGRMTGNTLKHWIEKKCTEKILTRVVKREVKVILVVTPPKRIGSSKGTLEMQKLVKEIAKKTGTDFMSVYAPNKTGGGGGGCTSRINGRWNTYHRRKDENITTEIKGQSRNSNGN